MKTNRILLGIVIVMQLALIALYLAERAKRGSDYEFRKDIIGEIMKMGEASRGVYDAGIPDGFRDRADLLDYVSHREALKLTMLQHDNDEIAGIYTWGGTSGVYTEFLKLFKKEPHQWSAFATVFYLEEPTEIISEGDEIVIVAKKDRRVVAKFTWPPLSRPNINEEE